MVYAYQKTNGYRALYDEAGVKPEDIRTLDDIRILPFVTKELIRDNIEEFSVADPSRRKIKTSGTTGVNFEFFYPQGLDAMESAFVTTGWSRVGWKENMRQATLRGRFVGDEETPFTYVPENNELLLSTFILSQKRGEEQIFDRYLKALKRYGPEVLYAYPSSLHMLCDILEETGKIGDLNFKIILIASENVYDWLIEEAQTVFPGARIFAWYGQTEMVVLAAWCEHTRQYHVCPYYGYTELLDSENLEAREGEEAEIIGTDFHNHITPFLRYRTGDIAIKGKLGCPSCGRQYRLIDRIIGRSHEAVVSKTGQFVTISFCAGIYKIIGNVYQFRFYQDTPGIVVFRFIPKTAFSRDNEIHIRRELERRLGPDVELIMEQVDNIRRTPHGKHTYLDQRLPVRYHEKD